jgi:mannitol-1-phosphate/altronate dehydrogenase
MTAADITISKAAGSSGQEINAICIGSGRFLRSVLVPLLASHAKPCVFQTRGRTFLDFFSDDDDDDNNKTPKSLLTYPVDTVEFDGTTTTSEIEIYAAGTLGTTDGRSQLMDYLVSKINSLTVIGVGVTEAGLQNASNQCMIDLTELLFKVYTRMSAAAKDIFLQCPNPHGKICIINTDNLPNNGDLIRDHVMKNGSENYSDSEGFIDFIQTKVAFLNTMVDRITSSRPNSDGLVPLCEPLPMKALVICDPGKDLPSWMLNEEIQSKYGVKIRHHPKELEFDIALKLRVANGTHTAVAHVMAVSSLVNTEALCDSSPTSPAANIIPYVDSLYHSQILPAAVSDGITAEETEATWADWKQRLLHPKFGLSTFFITQNGAAKCGIRLGPTIKGLINARAEINYAKENPISVSMAFAVAAILRFLTPSCEGTASSKDTTKNQKEIYTGWLDTTGDDADRSSDSTVTYADGLRYNLQAGWYEFRCSLKLTSRDAQREMTLPDALSKFKEHRQPSAYHDIIKTYLLHPQGGDLQSLFDDVDDGDGLLKSKMLDSFVSAVSVLYARMVSGDKMIHLLAEMMQREYAYKSGLETSCQFISEVPLYEQDSVMPLHYSVATIPAGSSLMKTRLKAADIHSVVWSEVRGQDVIDLHTHLLPPSHGALCLWGIDEMLTYHYLISEFFMTAPANITPEGFFAMNKKDQADLIWESLFIQRSPISEATRGVLTTLQALGLQSEMDNRDLDAIRRFYDGFRDAGLEGVEKFVGEVFRTAGVKYAIMTNIPFDSTEARCWRPTKKVYPETFKSALRVDPLLAGDKKTVENALKASGYGTSLDDARKYLHDWCDTMKPEYLMASTPHDFSLSSSEGGGTLSGVIKRGVNESSLQSPFAFTELTGNDCNDCEATDNMPSIINESSDFLTEVLMSVCEERDLPLALKIGAHRSVNPALLSAGDGLVAFADTNSLARLCGRFPKVRFLATFLSRNNQQEACVLASKFRNLHIYGCWWFCNNPSIIEDITKMRVEMLGTAFTAQHSDSRVVDQLIYKWAHSRAIIAKVLAKEYEKVLVAGWTMTRQEIRRDVRRLFGESFSDFMAKSLK